MPSPKPEIKSSLPVRLGFLKATLALPAFGGRGVFSVHEGSPALKEVMERFGSIPTLQLRNCAGSHSVPQENQFALLGFEQTLGAVFKHWVATI